MQRQETEMSLTGLTYQQKYECQDKGKEQLSLHLRESIMSHAVADMPSLTCSHKIIATCPAGPCEHHQAFRRHQCMVSCSHRITDNTPRSSPRALCARIWSPSLFDSSPHTALPSHSVQVQVKGSSKGQAGKGMQCQGWWFGSKRMQDG